MSYLRLLFARFFVSRVDDIIAVLDKMEEKLHAFAAAELKKALQEDLQAEALYEAASARRSEASRATRIASRIHGLKE